MRSPPEISAYAPSAALIFIPPIFQYFLHIQKMYNGEKALHTIKNEITIKSNLIDNMFDLHMALFCLGAITKLIYAEQKSKYTNDYKRWKAILKRNTYRLILKKDVSLYRKMMLCGGSICPQLLAFLDKKRRKKISQGSF